MSAPVRPDLVIFDFDGTLADSLSFFRTLLPDLSRKFRFRLPDFEEQEAMRGYPPRDVMRALKIPTWKLPFIAMYARKRASAADAFPLFEGTRSLLQSLLDEGVPVAIVSSNAEAVVRRALGPDISARISAWSCGAAMFGKAKHFRGVLRELNVSAPRATGVGDETRDVEAAREVGIRPVCVCWGFAPREALEAAGPDKVFDKACDLQAFLLGRA